MGWWVRGVAWRLEGTGRRGRLGSPLAFFRARRDPPARLLAARLGARLTYLQLAYCD